MLKLINITKSYGKNLVLKDINLEFSTPGFITILGTSGSGKSTLLKVIGGLIKYDKGNVEILNRNLNTYSEKEYDNYRSNYISYIYQDYYLIDNLTVYDNVVMPLNIIKMSKREKKRRVYSKLKLLHIEDLAHKKVSTLSGGEKQRVAIARAIIKNPLIVLADEPTGALDSKNSIIVMDILKELSKSILVIVVSHNEYLAKRYSNRIIRLSDGKVVRDETINKYHTDYKVNKIIKPHLSFRNAIKLSLNNLWSKKIRTILISLACSISIISLCLVLSVSQNTLKEIKILEDKVLVNSPIVILHDTIKESSSTYHDNITKKEDSVHTNIFNNTFLDTINSLNTYTNGIYYDKLVDINIMSNDYNYLDYTTINFIPSTKIINNNYDIVYGRLPNNYNELVLLIDKNNQVSSTISKIFNDNLDYDNILNKEFKLILNNSYYLNYNDMYYINNNYSNIYNNSSEYLKIVGIIKPKEDNMLTDSSYILYSNDLIKYITSKNSTSDIIKKQELVDYSILDNTILNDNDKEILLSRLGYGNYINGIYIYPSSKDNKDIITNKLDNYQDIIYEDASKYVIDTVVDFVNILTIILMFFSILSIAISIIMMMVITYISTIEREKEIILLRTLGVRRRDIKKIFSSENFIIGLISMIIGLISVYLISNPINNIIYNLIGIEKIVNLNIDIILVSLITSLLITKLGGIIPISIYSKKIN